MLMDLCLRGFKKILIVGNLKYAVIYGGAFDGESMFYYTANASLGVIKVLKQHFKINLFTLIQIN